MKNKTVQLTKLEDLGGSAVGVLEGYVIQDGVKTWILRAIRGNLRAGFQGLDSIDAELEVFLGRFVEISGKDGSYRVRMRQQVSKKAPYLRAGDNPTKRYR